MALFQLDFQKPPYQMARKEKDEVLTGQLMTLLKYHRERCPSYARILNACGFSHAGVTHYRDIPFLPVGLFKRLSLDSLSKDQADYKTVTSSGTSGTQSRIILDGETRTLQQQALAAIGSDFIGKKRVPMLVIDCPSTVEKRDHFSARTSGILGFSLFARKRIFALREDMSLNEEAVKAFQEQYGSEPFLIFGFTFLVWKFCTELQRRNLHLDLSHAVLIHGGGWKKLWEQRISKEQLKELLHEVCGVSRVHDYYGMAEQTGSIFMECACGHLHCSDYSGILIRRAEDFSLCEKGEKGIIQVLSVLPHSYPGHSLLTEDEGILLGEDDCACGRKGAYFQVLGRLKNAEIRGCSDTYAEF